MNISFENKVALVTGAASGLGLATAKAFAESGASVVLADWDEKEVQAAAKGLADQGHKTLAVRCDVSDDAQVEAMVMQTVATFGRLDAAYNNAGVQNVLAETADSPRDDYDRIMGINLRGVWSCMKFELQQMRKQGSGAIVNCSSLGGLIGGAQRLSLIHIYVARVTEAAYRTTAEDVQILRDHGWSEPQIAEAVYITAMFAFFNRVADAFGISPQGYLEMNAMTK